MVASEPELPIYISDCKQNRNTISTSIPMFSGSSYAMRLIKIMFDQTGSGISKMAASKPSNTCTATPIQEINDNPTATPLFRGSVSNESVEKTA